MSAKLLKWSRVAVALTVFIGITAALVDFRGFVPASVGHQLAGVQFVPSVVALVSGASLSLAGILILLVTLAVGRIYCSAVCPLGIFQDVVIRLRQWFSRKPRRLRYVQPFAVTREVVLWATVALAIAWHAGLVLTLVDPYSNYGRIAADLFRPLVSLANNVAVGIGEQFDWHGLYRVDISLAGAGALAVPVGILLLVVIMAAWRGRLYCNTLCPVGALLGRVSKRSFLHLQLDQSACRKCGDCLRACKSQCIDLRSGEIDFSRCVACYNCLDVCQHQGIRYVSRKAPRVNRLPADEPAEVVEPSYDPRRRAFIARTIVGLGAVGSFGSLLLADEKKEHHRSKDDHHSPVICPRGSSSVEQFLARCTGCHLCISACPTQVLQPAFFDYGLLGMLRPRMDYATAFCNYDCHRCGEVCPDGAISRLGLAEKHVTKIGDVRFDRDKCVVVTNGTDCAACSEHCPTKAVFTEPFGENLRLPALNNDLCIGCGACEFACPVKPQKAITVVGHRKHGRAKIQLQPKAVVPSGAKDFAF